MNIYCIYSEFGPESNFYTSSPPPAAPSPPTAAPLPLPTPYSLAVAWPMATAAANGSVTYTLEMASVRIDDPSLTPEELSKRIVGGFMPVYHGSDCQFICTNLTPATAYLFRVCLIFKYLNFKYLF